MMRSLAALAVAATVCAVGCADARQPAAITTPPPSTRMPCQPVPSDAVQKLVAEGPDLAVGPLQAVPVGSGLPDFPQARWVVSGTVTTGTDAGAAVSWGVDDLLSPVRVRPLTSLTIRHFQFSADSPAVAPSSVLQAAQECASAAASAASPPLSPRVVTARQLVSLLRALRPPTTALGGVYRVRSISNYEWADGGPRTSVDTLQLDLTPPPPHQATLIRLIVYDAAKEAYEDLSTTAANFGSDEMGLDATIGRPASCWRNDGDDACQWQYGRILIDTSTPKNGYDLVGIEKQVVRWLAESVPLEDKSTPHP